MRWYFTVGIERDATTCRSETANASSKRRGPSSRAPASLRVPSNNPSRASRATDSMSVWLARLNASRHSWVAASPNCGALGASRPAGWSSVVLPRRWVIWVVSGVSRGCESLVSEITTLDTVSSPGSTFRLGLPLPSANALLRSYTNAIWQLAIRITSPSDSVTSPVTFWPFSRVPLRLSRSRNVHWPCEEKISAWYRLQRSSLTTIWLVGARPTVTVRFGSRRDTSDHFAPSRITK